MKTIEDLPVYQGEIRRFCERVVKAFNPACIILHGSYTRGNQADTVVPGAGSTSTSLSAGPMAWGRYAYVEDNPLRYTDPTGHKLDPGGGNGGLPEPEPGFDGSLGGNNGTNLPETEPEDLSTAQKIGLGLTAGLTSVTITWVEGFVLVGGIYIATTGGPVGIAVDVLVVPPVELFLEDVKVSVNLYASRAIITGEKGEVKLTILPLIKQEITTLFKP